MLALGLLCCALVVLTGAEFNPHIVGGSDADYGDHHYICSLQTMSGFHFCGAVIYNKRFVATAAHCVDGAKRWELVVVCGNHNLSRTDTRQVTHFVRSIIMHESYNQGPGAFPNDIAVLELKQPLEFNEKVEALPFAEEGKDYADVTCVLSGWGRLSGGGPSPDILQEVEITALSQGACEKIWNTYNINDGHICVQDTSQGKTGSCNGDSGGPMRCNNTIVGITSWGRTGCRTEWPSVYTRVSHFQGWLNEKTGGQSE